MRFAPSTTFMSTIMRFALSDNSRRDIPYKDLPILRYAPFTTPT